MTTAHSTTRSPGPALRPWLALSVLALSAWVSVRASRRDATPLSLPPARPSVELVFRVETPAGAAEDALFRAALSTFVASLQREGARVGGVEPERTSARVKGDGLDDARLARARGELPLDVARIEGADGGGGPGIVRARLTDAARARATRADALALDRAAVALRSAAASSGLFDTRCPGCAPTVERTADGALALRLPFVDDVTERALMPRLLATELPAELVAGMRLRLVARHVSARATPREPPTL